MYEKFFNKEFKLKEVKYCELSNTLSMKIITRDELTIREKEVYLKELQDYIGLDIQYNIEIVSSLCDSDLVKEIESLVSKYKIGDNLLFESCSYSKQGEMTSLNLKLSEANAQFNEFEQVKNEINDIIKEKCNGNYFINICNSYNENQKDILVKRDDLLLENIDKVLPDENPLYEVKDLEVVIGKHLDYKVRKISSIRRVEEGLLLAGKVKYLRENYYVPKNSVDGEQKIRYNFELVDHTGKINATYFPTKAMLENENFKFEDEQELEVYCDVVEYNERLSIRIREIAKCSLPCVEVKKEVEEDKEQVIEFIEEVANEYKTISPQNYAELEQMDIFTIAKETPNSLIGKDFVVFDLETTGFEPEYCEIIEIGAVKIRNGEIIETFTTLIRPGCDIPENITEITGISNDMVVFAPELKDVISDFYKFTRNAILVAHNASFDTKFLSYHAKKLRYKFENDVQDTLAMARELVKGIKNYKLKTLSDHFNIRLVDAHRALNDTIATAKVFIELNRLVD